MVKREKAAVYLSNKQVFEWPDGEKSRRFPAVGTPCAKDAALSRWLIEVRALPGASYAAFSGLTHHVRAGIRPRVNRFKWTICRKFSKSGVIRLIRIYDGMNLP